MKKFKQTMLALLLCCLCVGLSACGAKAKTFSKEGLTITLTTEFQEKEIVSQTLYLQSSDVIFVALKETNDSLTESGYNVEEMNTSAYAKIVIENNNVEAIVEEDENLTTFSFCKNVSGKNICYVAYTFKGTDAFWLCQFACDVKDEQNFRPQFKVWAQTIIVE